MSYLVAEVLLRLVKPAIAMALGLLLYWFATAVAGEPGSLILGLICWLSAAALITLLETGII